MHHEDTKDTKTAKDRANELSHEILGAAVEVHRLLGPGLLESTYENCLSHELTLRGLVHARQVALPVLYKSARLECGYRMDLIVDGLVVVELKAVEALLPIHKAQVLTYLKLSGLWLGLLLNFNARRLKEGIVRLVH
ncbi:MAG TPA: GxxExxY protein [Planctomycetota bacterium]